MQQHAMKIRGLCRWLRAFWSYNCVPRNRCEPFWLDLYLCCLGQLCVFIIYYVWPFKLTGVGLVFGVTFYMAYLSVERAHHYFGYQLSCLVMGTLSLHFHLTWGFQLFGYPLEPYLCYLVILGAMVGLCRRGWNRLRWLLVDYVRGV